MKRAGIEILFGVVKRRKLGLLIGLSALIGVDLIQLYVPRIIKQAVDGLTFGAMTQALLVQLGLVILALAVTMALLRMVWRPLLMGFARTVEAELRRALFSHLQSMHLGYLTDNPPGELMARTTNDLNNIRMAAGIGLVAAMDGTVMALCALGYMIYISPLLTLVAVLPMPGIVLLARVKSRQMHKGFTDVQESFGEITELVREGLSGIRLVKAYGLAGRELGRLASVGRKYLDINMDLARVLGLFFPVLVLFTNLSLAIVLGVGGPLTVLGNITPGDFVAFSAYLNMLTWPMMALGWVVSLAQRSKASMERVEEVLHAEPGVQDPPETQPLPGRDLGLETRRLDYTYPGASSPALADVSVVVPPGETTAVVGRMASGKSTLLGLISRLHEPPEGAVFLGGVDIRRAGLKQLRQKLVQVTQQAFIFSTTIRANLVLGNPSAGEKEQWAALEAAELAEDVRELEQGLETRLGEKGHTLSGGQRQRLSLARALLADPEILLLDDPLSAVDTETEARILGNLGRMRSGRTTLVVSHRLASVAFAHCIYALEKGRVVEAGTHDQLMARGGVYHALFSEQALLAQLEA